MKRPLSFLATFAIALALALSTVFALPSVTAAQPQSASPEDTIFIAKYDLPDLDTPTAGSDVITFSDLVVVGGELKRFDFQSSVPIAYVYVKAGSESGDSGDYDYRSAPVTSGNDLLTPTGKGVSHISFYGPTPPTTGAIQVTKYNDINGNGSRDDGEPTLSGWSFTVQTAAGASAAGTITTSTSGSGTLADLTPGEYNVIETLAAGWTNTDPGGTSPTKTTTVVAGQTQDLVFGNRALPTTGAIQVTKYNDLNGSGARDEGEPALAGWSFTVQPPEGAPLGPIVTDGTGSGTLSGIAPGEYTVIETLASGWANTDPGGTSPTKTTTVVAGQTQDLVFGNRALPTTGAIQVTKYNDLNRNGAQDQAEPLLATWSFAVRNAAGVSAGSITTGTSGSGTLSGLAPGDYTVIETLQTNWHNSDPAGGTLTKTATVVAGQTAPLVFGNYYDPPPPPPPVPGRLTVVKYHDVDRDGARDQGEPLLSGWTFSVMSGNAIVHTLVTGADGSASVTLSEGTYSVLETQQILWTSTDPGGAAPSKGVLIGPGSAITLLFGNAHVLLPPTSETVLTVVKYHDANANGVRESTEPVLSGFTFLIRDVSGAMVRTATTDDSGMAVVTNLPLGAYTIVEQPRPGWYNTDPGGAATRPAMLSENALGATVIFGNAAVMLPSTATDDGTARTLLVVVLGLVLVAALGIGTLRYRI